MTLGPENFCTACVYTQVARKSWMASSPWAAQGGLGCRAVAVPSLSRRLRQQGLGWSLQHALEDTGGVPCVVPGSFSPLAVMPTPQDQAAPSPELSCVTLPAGGRSSVEAALREQRVCGLVTPWFGFARKK